MGRAAGRSGAVPSGRGAGARAERKPPGGEATPTKAVHLAISFALYPNHGIVNVKVADGSGMGRPWLSVLPALRIPVGSKDVSGKAPADLVAYLAEAVGDAVSVVSRMRPRPAAPEPPAGATGAVLSLVKDQQPLPGFEVETP
jgi:hypothetical protein